MDPDPGPTENTLLVLQGMHRSKKVWKDERHGPKDTCVLKVRRHEAVLRRGQNPDNRVLALVRRAGFGGLYDMGFVKLDHPLITALVERWRPETHTFHLTSGEETITLQDVEVLFGLCVDGPVVSGSTNVNWNDLCIELLGQAPSAAKNGGKVPYRWLADTFSGVLPIDATDVQVAQHTRGYILQLIGGTLFTDHSGKYVHLMFLQLLRDFDIAARYSWGSAALAWLYHSLCHGAKSGSRDVGGPYVLLQVWARDRFPHVSPHCRGIGPVPPQGPLIGRWHDQLWCGDVTTHVLREYCLLLDLQTPAQVVWTPYSQELLDRLPPYCRAGSGVWRAVVPLICFAIVELHQPNCVMRQFGLRQVIPVDSQSLLPPHGSDLRAGAHYYRILRRDAIAQWDQRRQHLVEGDPDDGIYLLDDPYLVWYNRHTRRSLSRLGAQIQHTRGILERLLAVSEPGGAHYMGLKEALASLEAQYQFMREPPPLPAPIDVDENVQHEDQPDLLAGEGVVPPPPVVNLELVPAEDPNVPTLTQPVQPGIGTSFSFSESVHAPVPTPAAQLEIGTPSTFPESLDAFIATLASGDTPTSTPCLVGGPSASHGVDQQYTNSNAGASGVSQIGLDNSRDLGFDTELTPKRRRVDTPDQEPVVQTWRGNGVDEGTTSRGGDESGRIPPEDEVVGEIVSPSQGLEVVTQTELVTPIVYLWRQPKRKAGRPRCGTNSHKKPGRGGGRGGGKRGGRAV